MTAQSSRRANGHCNGGAPKTLSDLMELLEPSMANDINRGSTTSKRHLSAARTTAKHLQRLRGVSADSILLDELVEIDLQLVSHLEGEGMVHQSVIQYVYNKDKLLEQAHVFGWRCDSFELRMSWNASRLALKGNAGGGLGIIDDAIRSGVRPCDYTAQHLAVWKLAQLDRGRSLLTINTEECHFRRQLRMAGLQKAFKGFDLRSKNPSVYAAKLEDLHPDLRRDIETVMGWKVAKNTRGRDAKLAIRADTATNLRKTLLQICGFSNCEPGPEERTRLCQVIVPEIICPLVDWQVNVRKCKRTTIVTRLSAIHHLVCNHEFFARRDYSWIRTKLNRIAKEPKHLLEERKKQKYVEYDLLATVPGKIRDERIADKELNAIERAWMVHDELFMRWPLSLPWRQRNLRELALSGSGPVSLIYGEIPEDVKHGINLPPWVRRALKKNPRQRFWQFIFMADGTKGKRAVRGIIPHELLSLLETYLKTHRPLLIGPGDSGTLFLNRNSRALTSKDLLGLVTRLSCRHTGTRVTPHILRDIYAANFLAKGGKIEDLQQELWHVDIETTYEYCKRFDVSCSANDLDAYFASVDPTRMPGNYSNETLRC